MYTPQQWAIVLSQHRSKVEAEARKLPRTAETVAGDLSRSLVGIDARVESIEATMVDFQTAFNNLVDALRETDEKLARAEGMLRFCYAICQSPGIKDLAERTKDRVSDRLSQFGGFGNSNNRMGGGGGNAKPRPGLGSAGRP